MEIFWWGEYRARECAIEWKVQVPSKGRAEPLPNGWEIHYGFGSRFRKHAPEGVKDSSCDNKVVVSRVEAQKRKKQRGTHHINGRTVLCSIHEIRNEVAIFRRPSIGRSAPSLVALWWRWEDSQRPEFRGQPWDTSQQSSRGSGDQIHQLHGNLWQGRSIENLSLPPARVRNTDSYDRVLIWVPYLFLANPYCIVRPLVWRWVVKGPTADREPTNFKNSRSR